MLMDTKNQTPAKIPAVRTYAGDLELGRKTKDTTTKEKKPAEEKVAPSKEEELMKEVEKELPLIVSEPTPKNTSINTVMTVTPEVTKIKKVTSTKTTPVIPRRDTFIAENADSAPATIITDAKHDRFKLMPAIRTSIKSWFTSKKDSYHAKKIPKYTISETSKRKEVIQKATSNTGKLATADFSSIHERIRNRNENEKKNNPPTTWSANTEPGFLLLEEPDTSGVTNIQMISRRSFRTVPQEIRVTEINHNRKSEILSPREYPHPTIIEPTAPETTPVPVPTVAKNIISAEKIAEKLALLEEIDDQRWHPETVVTVTPTAVFETETTTKNEPSPLPVKLAQIPSPEVQVSQPLAAPRWISETPAETVPVEVSKPVSLPATKLEQPEPVTKAETSAKPVQEETPRTAETRKKILSLNTNILTLGVSGLAIAIILFVGFSYFWVAEQIKLDSSQVATELPMLIDVPLKKIAGVDDSKENLLQALAATGKENNDAIQVVFLSSKPNYEPISPSNLLSTFDIFLEQNFAQSISDIRFGIAKDKQPFVIIKTTHETAAKGGLLMWENGMYEDLAEILSIKETDPIANTKFVDASLNGIDVRVLKNKNGTERLIYGFTKDTIIITTNIFNFSELAKSVK